MTKFKKSFLKYFFFAGAIIFLLAYTFTTWLPKSSQMAKEEALELIFGKNNEDTIKVEKSDSIKTNAYDFYTNNEVNIEGALSAYFNNHEIEITYVGIPESNVPAIIDGELKYISIDTGLRAKRVRFKVDGNTYNIYVIYNRLTGEVSNIINDERYINNGKEETTDTIQYGEQSQRLFEKET